MSYYRRATVLLALGKSKSALPDLDKVIELRPDFISVRDPFFFMYIAQHRLQKHVYNFLCLRAVFLDESLSIFDFISITVSLRVCFQTHLHRTLFCTTSCVNFTLMYTTTR